MAGSELPLPSYSAIYAFGDSLSDAGNLSMLTAAVEPTPVSPPYAQEQYGLLAGTVFSNGPTWVQDLSVALGLGTLAPSLATGNDFAYGGAETGPTPQNASDPGVQAISLPAQLTQFQAKVSSPPANALYTISIGSNDLLDIIADTALTAQQQVTDVAAAVANEIGFVRQLVGDGARNLLVLGIPDLGKTPSVMDGQATGTGTPSAAVDAEASGLASDYNSALSAQLAAIVGLDAHVVDAYGLIDAAVADPAAYGLSNATTPVWSGSYTSAASGTLSSTNVAQQDQNLFWDHLHPTETGHQAIATAAEQDLNTGGVAAIVTRFYANILQRAPDAAGLAGWDAAISSGALTYQQVDYAFATSAEAQTDVAPIVRLYTALGRVPDAGGLQGWVNDLQGSLSLTAIAGDFLASPEGEGIYGTAAGAGSAANLVFVDKLYQQVLGRAADAAGAQGWTADLSSGALTPAQVLADFTQSPEATARDATPVTNFLLASGNGDGSFGVSVLDAALFPTAASGAAVSINASTTQPVVLGSHSASDTVSVVNDADAVYGSGNVVTVDDFLTGIGSTVSDMMQFLAGGSSAVAITAATGSFGSGIDGTGKTGLTATAASGILSFAGPAAATASLAQLIAAAGNILDDLASPANMSVAFQHGGSTYLLVTPSAATAGIGFTLATDHVFDLANVTGAASLAGAAGHDHSIIV
nr:DUF4214 domain-containing protein [uncultured Lichenicoccus sp.]